MGFYQTSDYSLQLNYQLKYFLLKVKSYEDKTLIVKRPD